MGALEVLKIDWECFGVYYKMLDFLILMNFPFVSLQVTNKSNTHMIYTDCTAEYFVFLVRFLRL